MEPLLRRPNGRPQACEPCRKRKVACDHTQPICRRCTKKKQEYDCVYIISSPGQARRKRSKSPRIASAALSPSLAAFSEPNATGLATSPQVPEAPRTNPAINTNPGYLGFTSFCGVYEETQNSLSLIQGQDGTPSSSYDIRCPGARESRDGGAAFLRIREKCLTILRNAPDAAQGRYLSRSYYSPMEAWLSIVARRVLDSFYAEFGRHLGPGERSTAQLEEVAHRLCVNTTRQFSDDENNPDAWIGQLCGDNLRWESVGILFNRWDLSANPKYSSQALMKDRLGRKGWAPLARECFNLCMELCQEFSNGNSVMAHLAWRRTVNESMFTGDASLATWRTDAEQISLLTYLGFHDDGPADPAVPYIPTLSSEVKRRIFAYSFTTHISTVSFTGRPPLFCRRYTSTPLPLDIKDEELFADEATLAKTIEYVDEDGWNTRGEFYPATFFRARVMIAFIREEIFEFALGHNRRTPMETLLELKARQTKTISQFPSCLIYRRGNLADLNLNVEILYCRLIIELDNMQNMFFIERLLKRYGQQDTYDLIAVSFDMVTFTLPFWTHVDRLAGMRSNCEWLVMGFAAPAGGILCMELLKPTLPNGQHPTDSRITRSGIVQKLSLLVGFLDWVNPSAPNGDLCSECKSVIQRVLDQTLNAPPQPLAAVDGGFNAAGEVPPEPLLGWDFPAAQLDFNFDLLDTFDWLRPDVNSSQ